MDEKTHPVLLVIPCYQESQRLPPFLNELCTTFEGSSDVTLLIVDDGSGPEEEQRMRQIIEAARAKFTFVAEPLFLPGNVGKGGAIYQGWQGAKDAEWLAFVDADGSCSANEVKRLIGLAHSAEDDIGALFASRVKILGRAIHRELHRHLMGRIYATLVSESLKIPVYDSQCGLKLVRHSAYKCIEPLLKLHRFAFDAELLCALLDSRYKVHEIPIDWHETPGSKIRFLHDSFEMLRDILSVHARRKSREWVDLTQNQPPENS